MQDPSQKPTPDEQKQIDSWLNALVAHIEDATAAAQRDLERIRAEQETQMLEWWFSQ